MQITLEEKYFFCFLVGELLLFRTVVAVLLTPNFFLFIQDGRGVLPFYFVFVLALVFGKALHKALIVYVKTVANPIAGLAVLVFLGVYGFPNHFTVLSGGTRNHSNRILSYVVQSLISELIESLGHA